MPFTESLTELYLLSTCLFQSLTFCKSVCGMFVCKHVCVCVCVFFVSFDVLMICIFFYIVMFWVVMSKNSAVWCYQCFHVASWDHTFLHFFHVHLVGPLDEHIIVVIIRLLRRRQLLLLLLLLLLFLLLQLIYFIFSAFFTNGTVLYFQDICIKFYLKSYLLNPSMPVSVHFMDPLFLTCCLLLCMLWSWMHLRILSI